MQGTGHEALAQSIAETQNNAYVKEMIDDNILEWADNQGFSVDELALIQPNYGPCYNWSPYTEIVKPTCDKSNGSIQLNGNEINSIEWENGTNSLKLDNLSAGVYKVSGLYIDITPCPFEYEIVLENENSADLDVNVLDKQSCGKEDGLAEVLVSNANGNYEIEWSNGATDSVISNLIKGSYLVTVTDAMNCKAIGKTYVSEINTIYCKEIVSGSKCNESTGSIHLDITGGSGNYSTQWMDGDTSAIRTNLAVGNYSVVISNEAGCQIEKDITIYDDCDGKINCEDDYVEVNNQHGAYIYLFANDEDPYMRTISSFEISKPKYGSASTQFQSLLSKKIDSSRYIYYKGDATYTGIDSFSYTVCTNFGFCDSATVYLNVVSKPVVSLSSPSDQKLQMYSGEQKGFYLRGAKFYSISPDTGIHLFSSGHFVATAKETTTYTVKGTNQNGQTDTFKFTIEVILPNFEVFDYDIQMHKNIQDNLLIVGGGYRVQDYNFRIFDVNGNDVLYKTKSYEPFTIDISNLNGDLHYFNIQYKYSFGKNVILQTTIEY